MVDTAKAVAYALVTDKYHDAVLNINGPELMTLTDFVNYGNEATGNNVTYQAISDEENYAIFDEMGVPRTTEGAFKKRLRSTLLFRSMVTFGEAIRLGKMDNFTDDFKQLTGEEAITVKYMFENADDFQVGERHSEDK